MIREGHLDAPNRTAITGEGGTVRKFAAVAIVCTALCLAVLIGTRAMVLNGVYDLGPAVNFEPQIPVATQQSPQLSPSAPPSDKGGQP